jgi:hypothetical protein
MNPSKLIEAKLQGADLESIIHAVRTDRETVSQLPKEKLEFFESTLDEIRKTVGKMEQAIKSDNLSELKSVAGTMKDLFLMVEDSCDES